MEFLFMPKDSTVTEFKFIYVFVSSPISQLRAWYLEAESAFMMKLSERGLVLHYGRCHGWCHSSMLK